MSIEALTIFEQGRGLLNSARARWRWWKERDKQKAAKVELTWVRALRRREGSAGICLVADEANSNFDLYEWMADKGLLTRAPEATHYLLPEDRVDGD